MTEMIGGTWYVSDQKRKLGGVYATIHRRLQKNAGIEIYIVEDEKELTLGQKRELMYRELAAGKYAVQWDSDDDIHSDFFKDVMAAIKEKPDCVTYEEYCWMNGREARSNHSLNYTHWQDNFDGYDYTRTPFYKDVIKLSIAKAISFPHIRFNEDEQWAAKLLPHLRTEIHISKQLYRYIYNSQAEEHNNRYGIK
jgi:hypothetical protein